MVMPPLHPHAQAEVVTQLVLERSSLQVSFDGKDVDDSIFIYVGYPNTYANDLSVSMPIEVSSGSKIELTFVDIDIENEASCGYDYVQGRMQYLVVTRPYFIHS